MFVITVRYTPLDTYMTMLFITNIWNVMLELAPWLLFGTVLSTFCTNGCKQLIEQQLVASLIRKICPVWYSPTSMFLFRYPNWAETEKQGSSKGSTVGFLITTPQTGVDSLVSASFLGLQFLSSKLRLLRDGFDRRIVGRKELRRKISTVHQNVEKSISWFDAYAHGIDILRSIWRWLVFGILLSA